MSSRDVIDKINGWDERNMKETARSLKKKIAFLFAGVLFLAALLGLSVYLMLSSYQKTILKEQTQQMVYLVQSVTNSIEVYVEEYQQDLKLLAGEESFLACEATAAAGDSSDMEEYLLRQITVRGTDFGFAGYETPDHRQLSPQTWTDYKVVRTMTDSGGTDSVALVRTGEREFYLKLSTVTAGGGTLSYFLSTKELYEKTASYIALGENGYIMLKASDGRIITHPVEEQIGINVIDDRQAAHPDFDLTELSAMVDEQLEGKTGTAVYESYWWAEEEPSRVKKISAYQPAYLGDDFLIVSAVIDYSELSNPISNGVVRILAVAGLLGALLLLLLVILFLVMRNARRYEAENANLRKLNEQLEELRKREERLAHQQRLQLLGTMTGGIAHEFNNLLTPIMGYSAMLLAEADPESENHADLQEIYDSAEKAKEIIDQLSQFSGKNAEKTFRSLRVTQVIRKAMVMVESVKPRHVELKTELAETDATILGNPTQITQVLLNLCNNAFHAMREREKGLLTIGSQVMQPTEKKHPFFQGKEKDTFYRLTVRDNGCGMSPETLSQIYVPFFTTKKAGEGTGLGLSIVQRIVEAHGGLLCVTSRPGEGTEFVIYLPVEKPS